MTFIHIGDLRRRMMNFDHSVTKRTQLSAANHLTAFTSQVPQLLNHRPTFCSGQGSPTSANTRRSNGMTFTNSVGALAFQSSR